MKTVFKLFFSGVLMSALCAGFASCNEPYDPESGLGEEIPGMEIKKATGTVIGSYSNGFGSLLVQIDKKYPIGETIETVEYQRIHTRLPDDGTAYHNMIQVQHKLLVGIGSKISFSVREYKKDKDFWDLFAVNGGTAQAFGENHPNVPIYVITEYKIINN